MTVYARLETLAKKHEDLEAQIAEERTHPGHDEELIGSLKRRKLRLKDEMYRLRTETSGQHEAHA